MNEEVDKFLRNYSSNVRDLALKAQSVIRNVIPEAKEKVQPGWKVIIYSFSGNMKDGICAIAPLKDRININFFVGAEIDDPKGLLEGTGKKNRHIKISDSKMLDSEEIVALLKSSVIRIKQKQ